MKTAELRQLDINALITKLDETRKEAAESRRSLAAGELANPRVVRTQRRDIARLKMVIADQQRAAKNKEKENA